MRISLTIWVLNLAQAMNKSANAGAQTSLTGALCHSKKGTLEIAIHESSSIPRVPWRPPTRLGCWRAQMKTCRWSSRRFEGPSQPAHPSLRRSDIWACVQKRACLTRADLLGFRIRHILNDSVSGACGRASSPHLCVSSTGDSHIAHGRHGRVARFDVCETFKASLGKSSIPLDGRPLRTRLRKTTAKEAKGCASGGPFT